MVVLDSFGCTILVLGSVIQKPDNGFAGLISIISTVPVKSKYSWGSSLLLKCGVFNFYLIHSTVESP